MAGDASRRNGTKGGRPPGPSYTTLSKIEARELLRQSVMKHMDAMIEAQVANAKGLKYLVARSKTTGKFERLSQKEAEDILSGEQEHPHITLEVWEKDPSVQAFTDLMNRTLDKPPESEPDQPWKGELIVKWQPS